MGVLVCGVLLYGKSFIGCVDTMASYERPAIIFKNKRPELPVIASVVNRAEVKNSDKLSFEGMPDYLADVKAGLAEIVCAPRLQRPFIVSSRKCRPITAKGVSG